MFPLQNAIQDSLLKEQRERQNSGVLSLKKMISPTSQIGLILQSKIIRNTLTMHDLY